MRYGHAHLGQVYHVQLKNRLQNKGENQEFEADIARLVRLAYPTAPENFSEYLAVQTFVDGLRDTETQQALTLARPTSLINALAHVLEFETAKQASRSRGQLCAVDEQLKNEEFVEEVDRRMVDKVQKRRKTVRCWNCGETTDSNDEKSKQESKYRDSQAGDEESSYSSFYSSFLKTDTGSGSNDDSTNAESKTTKSNDYARQKCRSYPFRKRDPPWLEAVSVTPELIYKYQMSVKEIGDILESDLNTLKQIHQPVLVNDQLNQLYIEMELEGLSTKLTLEEGITSSSSSSDETNGHLPKVK
ncbi:period circadian protein [Holotrichia oblita]|uniref:Period circadian protein n=1 Tax=Holotrichia oblita TaxID=644536 RepID=A0ACB9TE65_HOLOL|nr:period circadian protein [Holotrichia oblita]